MMLQSIANWKLILASLVVYLPTPKNYIRVWDGSKHLFAFPFADFLKIQVKYALHFD